MRLKMKGNKNCHLTKHKRSHISMAFGLHNQIPMQILWIYICLKYVHIHNIFVGSYFQHIMYFLSLLHKIKEKYVTRSVLLFNYCETCLFELDAHWSTLCI